MTPEMRRIVREKLWKSIAWFGLALVGWQLLIDELAWLEQGLLTVFGLPVLTWAVLTAGTIGTRIVSRERVAIFGKSIGISIRRNHTWSSQHSVFDCI